MSQKNKCKHCGGNYIINVRKFCTKAECIEVCNSFLQARMWLKIQTSDYKIKLDKL